MRLDYEPWECPHCGHPGRPPCNRCTPTDYHALVIDPPDPPSLPKALGILARCASNFPPGHEVRQAGDCIEAYRPLLIHADRLLATGRMIVAHWDHPMPIAGAVRYLRDVLADIEAGMPPH